MVLFLLAGLFQIQMAGGQTFHTAFEPQNGLVQLTDDIAIPRQPAGYSVALPAGPPAGGLVFFHYKPDTLNAPLIARAHREGLAVVYLSSGNQLEFLFADSVMAILESYLAEATSRYGIPQDRLLFAGMSLEGTRALKMAQFAASPASRFRIRPRAVMACDAPLDFLRFWASCDKAERLEINEVAANEGRWVTAALEQNLGGTPREAPGTYRTYSPFYRDMPPEDLAYLRGVAIRLYSEPDVQWWITERGKDYYDMNTIDAAALVNTLRLGGHDQASLILTAQAGYLPDGRRHPHSWSIVDESELVRWFVGLE